MIFERPRQKDLAIARIPKHNLSPYTLISTYLNFPPLCWLPQRLTAISPLQALLESLLIVTLTDTATEPDLGLDFVPSAVDTFGAPSEPVATTIKYQARQISMQSARTIAAVATPIGQKLSFAG